MKIILAEPVDLATLASDAVLTDTDGDEWTRDERGRWYLAHSPTAQADHARQAHPAEPAALDPFTPHLG